MWFYNFTLQNTCACLCTCVKQYDWLQCVAMEVQQLYTRPVTRIKLFDWQNYFCFDPLKLIYLKLYLWSLDHRKNDFLFLHNVIMLHFNYTPCSRNVTMQCFIDALDNHWSLWNIHIHVISSVVNVNELTTCWSVLDNSQSTTWSVSIYSRPL